MSRVRLLQVENKRLKQLVIKDQEMLTLAREALTEFGGYVATGAGLLEKLLEDPTNETIIADARAYLNGPSP